MATTRSVMLSDSGVCAHSIQPSADSFLHVVKCICSGYTSPLLSVLAAVSHDRYDSGLGSHYGATICVPAYQYDNWHFWGSDRQCTKEYYFWKFARRSSLPGYRQDASLYDASILVPGISWLH